MREMQIDDTNSSVLVSDRDAEQTLLDFFERAVTQMPNKVAVTTYASGNRSSLTYAEIAAHVDAIAGNLLAMGLGQGSVVSYQLPNWWQAIALHLAALKIGAVSNPLMPFLRERDLQFMLSLADTDLFVTPAVFRGFDHQQMARRLLAAVPTLKHIRIVGGDPGIAFEEMLLEPPCTASRAHVGREDIVQYLFTSGTTGEPKCVIHTSRSLLTMMEQTAETLHLSDGEVVFMAMPLSHQGGFITAIVLPIMLGATTVLQDRWQPLEAVRIFTAERVTMTLGATPFLSDITDIVEETGERPADLRIFITSGAAIPRSLIRRAKVALRCHLIPSWGMSECGFSTMAKIDSTEEKICTTDGCALPLMEVRVVDDQSLKVPLESEGRLQVRGPNLFSSYLKRPELSALEPGGWFDTGDLARMDEDGYIRITGRTKDIVIRGGENIPVVEIEQVMYRHPSVLEFAVVGMPDERLGERLCAFAVLRPNCTLSLAEMTRYLADQSMAKSYWPEHLVCVEAMPRTQTGKIQKFILRDQAKLIAPNVSVGKNDDTKTNQ